jgi:hypothetical protein
MADQPTTGDPELDSALARLRQRVRERRVFLAKGVGHLRPKPNRPAPSWIDRAQPREEAR